VALKKPSDFFGKKDNDDTNISSGPQDIPEKFDVYKSNVKNIETLNEFTESFGSLKNNIAKIQELESIVEELRGEISKSLSKEDLDNAIMSNLLILEDNIKKIQFNLKGINQKDLSVIREDVKDIANKVYFVFEQELPKYKKQVVESSLKTEEKINFINETLEYYKKEFYEKIETVNESVHNLIEQEVPKYQELLLNSKISNDKKIEKISEELVSKINSLTENTQKLNENLQEKSLSLESSFQDKVSSLENHILFTKKDIEETSATYKKLYQVIEAKGLADKNNFEEQQELIESLSKEIENAYQNFKVIKEEVEKKSQEQVENLQKLFLKKLNLLENDIEHENNKIKEANSILLDNVFTLKEQINKISFSEIDKKYNRISQKVSYIEEIFSKFNEKTVLINEGLLNEPPTTSNTDPLTPLNKNFVTLEQLQDHYRLFINRIQQQLSTIGGGGETRLEFLDDVDRDSAKVNGRFLKYDTASGKWIGAVGGGGGSQTLNDTLGLGNTSSLGMSVGISTFNNVTVGGVTTALVVNGAARITGILTIGTASLTLDGQNNIIKIGTGITLSESGNVYYSGIITASKFVGDGSLLTNLPGSGNSGYANTAGIATYATSSGIATYASNAGVATEATRFQTARTFEITGDVVASAIIFDGTGNVSLAATIQPNSVALGSDTTGDYVQSITGTFNQITVTSGTGESSTPVLSLPSNLVLPQDVTVTRDLQVNRNLNVTGNITIGGTTAFVNVQELVVSDPDIILGYRTDAFGNDVSNDNTANHGGVALASTEGSPLVNLFIAGIETAPATYKKIMWFKSGSFAGLGTDAWLINYAVGIGSTQFPSGTRLAAGSVQFTENDLAVVRNINSSGIITASSFIGNASSATYASTAGIATSVIGGISSVTQLRVSGVSTLGVSTFTGAVSFGTSAYFGDNDKLYFGDGNDLEIYHNGVNSIISDVGQGGLIVDGSSLVYQAAISHQFTNTSLSKTYAAFVGDVVTFYYDNNKKFETLGAGVSITGTTFTNDLSVSGVTTSSSFVKLGGTSSQFLKANGSVDSSTYLTTTGSGTNLTGIVTSIVAGTNVTISGSTGQVTINATGGGGSTLGIATAGGTVGTGVTLLDFRGAGISTVTVSSGIATINIEGGGSSPPEISSVMMSMIF
jgi:hypothetical protein